MLDPILIDGTTYNLTLDDVREYVVKDIHNTQQRELLAQQVRDAKAELRTVRLNATKFFQDEFAGNIDDDEITFTKDELNEFLESIGAEPIITEWEVTLDVRVTISGVSASNADDAQTMAENALSIDVDTTCDYSNMDFEVISASADKE